MASKKKEKEAEEEEVWEVWDALPHYTIRTPIEMSHTMIQSVLEALETAWQAQANPQGEVDFDAKGQQIVSDMRKALEEKYEPTWQVVCGRNYGSVSYTHLTLPTKRIV
eukprot:TRINITY_DN11032_c0_g1_i2.p3 TRINITY_DN11032_c0_g1~~TRINITY_DN11032_c0_g1_i2.p3  ORF type:complete len:109 (+),score=43.77 TRINITY_DN11032_c0_g1_i2:232-558(+)